MNTDDEDTEEAEVYAATEKMAQPTSDIPGTGDTHKLYERRAQQYLQLSDGGKALANAVKAVKCRNDSFNAHWLAGKSFVSMAMHDAGIGAFSNAIELCCVEEKRQEILIDLLVHYCSRINNLSNATDVFRNISGHTLATVSYELTKTRRFNAAYTAYSQLQKACPPPSDIHFDLQPLCDLAIVASETWIVDLVTYFLRYGSDHNTMTSQGGDTYVNVVVRMSLAAGVLGLLKYVLGNVVRPEELRGLSDCLGNTALHMAAQFQKCSSLVRLDVMTLLDEAGVDGTAKNIEGKTAGSYLSKDEKDVFQCHHEYISICSGMTATKMKQTVNVIYDDADILRSEDDIEELKESRQDEHIREHEIEKTTRSLNSPATLQSQENDILDNKTVQYTADVFLQMEKFKMVSVDIQEDCKCSGDSQSLGNFAEGNSIQEKTTSKPEQTGPANEEGKRPVQEPPISFSQDTVEESFKSFTTEEQITYEYSSVESVPNKPKQKDEATSVEWQCPSTVKDSNAINDTVFPNVQANLFEAVAPDANVRAKAIHFQKNDDKSDYDIQSHANFHDNDNSRILKKTENKTNGGKQGRDVTDGKMAISLKESGAQSHQSIQTSPTVLQDISASAELQCAKTDEENVQSLCNKNNLFKPKSPDDNADMNARITSGQGNDDKDDSLSQVSPQDIDNSYPQTEKEVQNESCGSEQGQGMSCNAIISKSSLESEQQEVLLNEKTLSDSTSVISIVNISSSDNDSRKTSDEVDAIDDQTVEDDGNRVRAKLDRPFLDFDEQFDASTNADEDDCETAHHYEKQRHDHLKPKYAVNESPSEGIPIETQQKTAAERKSLHHKIKLLYQEGKSWMEIKQHKKGFAVFGKLLQCAPTHSKNKYIATTIDHICTYLDDTDNSDIPENLIQVPDSHLQQILKGLLDRRKWFGFLGILCKQDSKETFMNLVNEIDLETVIGDPQFLRNTKKLGNLLKALLDIGANIDNEGQNCINACIKSGHYEILPLLLLRGAHPRHLTIYSGDTPVHAALTIALTKGHFDVFELLLRKFQEDSQVYHQCDPSLKDRNGDGLLHLTLRQPDSSQSRKAIDLLIPHIRNFPAILSKNKKGHFPSDLIRGKHDQRWQTLEHFFRNNPAESKRQKRKRKAAHRPTSFLTPLGSDTDTPDATEEFSFNEKTHDADSELFVDNTKVAVGEFYESTYNLTEEMAVEVRVKDNSQDEDYKKDELQEERREEDMSQGKEERDEYVLQEEETEGDGQEETEVEGNMQQNANAKEDELLEEGTEMQRKYEREKENEVVITCTNEKLEDTKRQDDRQDGQQEQAKFIRSSPARHTPCARCYKNMDIAKEHLRFKRTAKAYTGLAIVIGETHKHSNSNEHRGLVDEALTLVKNSLSTTPNPVIPEILARIPVDFYQMLIDSLTKEEKWKQVDILVRENRKHHGEHSLRDFAKNVNITEVIRHQSLVKQSDFLVQLIDNMLESGAIMENEGKTQILAAIQMGHFILLTTLFKRGGNPAFLSLEQGDTPLHAAMSIALERDKGNFTIFQMLVDVFRSEPEKFAYLNPNLQDVNGDCLFHLVARMKYNSIIEKATKLLCALKISAFVSNNEGKLPKDLLVNIKNDRRLQFFRLAVKTETEPAAMKMRQKQMLEEDVLDEEQDNLQHSTAEETQADSVPEKVPRKDKQLIFSKTSTQRETSRTKIEKMIYKLPDTPYSIFNPNVPQMEEGWRSRKSGRGQRGVKTDVLKEIKEGISHQADATDAAGAGSSQLEEQHVAILPKMQLKEKDKEENKHSTEVDVQAFDNLEWEVECTADALNTLRDNHVLPELKRRIVQIIHDLASGEWSLSFCKPVFASNMPKTLRLFEAELPNKCMILWELAIAFSPRLSESAERLLNIEQEECKDLDVKGGRIYSDVIRVWYIVIDHDDINECITSIIRSHNRGKECSIRKQVKGKKQTQFLEEAERRCPITYTEADAGVQEKELKENQQEIRMFCPPASSNDAEYHILKFYSFSSYVVNYIIHNKETNVEFPFRVTDLEHAIINLKSQSPILLLGRSGTGKTTCCLYRIWSQFQSYWSKAIPDETPLLPRRLVNWSSEDERDEEDEDENEDGEEDDDPFKELLGTTVGADGEVVQENIEEQEQKFDHLHQIFITKNAVLCNEVKKNFRELSHSCDLAKHQVETEDHVLPPRLQDIGDYHFPLFITSKQLLLMLDASLGQPCFFERGEDGGLKVDVQGWSDSESTLFPLLLAEESDDENDNEGLFDDFEVADERRAAKIKVDRRRQVTYEVFSEEIWPKICKQNSGKYHPSLVWTEIMSFIKGSFEALSKPSGFLGEEEYFELGKKRAPIFSGKRKDIYDLFQRYDHFKKQKFLFDETDLVRSIYIRLKEKTDIAWVIHQVFVDETQDFTQAELYLLARICQDPNQMFFTGDTAQSIMRGIAFRFIDLRSIFYDSKQSLQTHGVVSDTCIKVPKQVYQLLHNYRSHSGILCLASSILDLMIRFFPESFDRLNRDQGLFNGPSPVLIESCSYTDLAVLIRGSRRKTSHIECGAHQAILVVDEAARDSLPEELQLGLILTIYEAKGLEFDDILLYNFFKDSKANKEWRVVTKYLEELAKETTGAKGDNSSPRQERLVQIDTDVLQQTNRPRALKFDNNLHKLLNSELKHLYTAVTRARVNVWIFDEDQDKRAPMFEYFKARKLVKILNSTDVDDESTTTVGDMFAEKSSTEDWIKRGEDFMRHALYKVAAKCFIQGGNLQLHKVALAHQQALKASRTKDNHQRMCDAFLFAAEMFLDCSLPSKAARCLQNAREKEMELGAQLFEKIGLLEKAGEIYRKLKKPVEGSHCYEQLGHFNLAIETLFENENYDMAIDMLWRYNKLLEDLQSKGKAVPAVLLDHAPGKLRTRERLSHMAAEFHHRNGNKARMMVNLERLEHLSDRISFLENKGYFDQAATLLEKDGKYKEAIDLYLVHGKTKEALEAARRSTNKDLIGQCLLMNVQVIIWEKQENKLSDEKMKATKDEVLPLLQEAIDILLNTSNQELRGEACVLKGEITNEITDINESWGAFNKSNPKCEAGQLECMDWMVQNSDLHIYQNLSQVVIGMENLFGVLNLLVSSDKADGDRVFKYYGLRPTSDGFLKMLPQLQPRALNIMKHCLTNEVRKQTECEVARNKARDEICRFLMNRGKTWYTKITAALETLRMQSEQCRKYVLGLTCTKTADGGKCSARHDIMTKKDHQILLNIDLLHLKMDWFVQKGCDRLLKYITLDLTEMVKIFLPDNGNDHMARFKSCEVLLHHLMPSEHFPFRLTQNGSVRWPKERKILKEQMVCYLHAKFIDMNTTGTKTNADVFMKLFFLSNFFHLTDLHTSNLMMEYEMKIRKEYLNENATRIRKILEPFGFLVDDRDRRNISVHCVSRRFHEAYCQLTQLTGDPLEALIKFTNFIATLGRCNKSEILPEFSDFLMWLEYFTTIAVCFGAKNNQVTNYFFLPASYLSLVYFIDSSFPIKRNTTFELIRRYATPRGHNLTLSQTQAENIIGVLCGSDIQMNLIQLLFMAPYDRALDYGLAERLLVLCMTVLCNMGKALFPKKEADLMQQLSRIGLPEDCPKRLQNAVRTVQEANGLSDIAVALKDLLQHRDKEHVCLCQWTTYDRYGFKSSPLKNIHLLPLTFFDQNTKKMMTNPGEKSSTKENSDEVAGFIADLDTDMTTEEKVKWQSEQKMYEENQRNESAAMVITRFFKKIQFRAQCSILHCLVEEERQKEQNEKCLEKLQPFGIDDRACTICNVIHKKNQRNESAAMVITRFFKKIQFRAQCSILHCLVEEELQKEQNEKCLEKFQPFGIDDRACTICNVIFDNRSESLILDQAVTSTLAGPGSRSDSDQTNHSFVSVSVSGHHTNMEDEPEVFKASANPTKSLDAANDNQLSEESEECRGSNLKLIHEQSMSHIRNMEDFEKFKLTYETKIEARKAKIVEFIRKHNLKTEKGLQNYADVKLDLVRLVNQSDTVQKEFEKILADRDWENGHILEQCFNEAEEYFHIAKSCIEERLKKTYETKDVTAESSKDQLEDVVQEPVRKRVRIRKGKGRRQGRANHRHQEDTGSGAAPDGE